MVQVGWAVGEKIRSALLAASRSVTSQPRPGPRTSVRSPRRAPGAAPSEPSIASRRTRTVDAAPTAIDAAGSRVRGPSPRCRWCQKSVPPVLADAVQCAFCGSERWHDAAGIASRADAAIRPPTASRAVEHWKVALCHGAPSCRCARGGVLSRARAQIPTLADPSRTVDVGVHECTGCGALYVLADVLRVKEQQNGLLLFERLPPATGRYTSAGRQYSEDSILSRYGYFAGQSTDPGEATRRMILEMLVSTGLASPGELETLLGRFWRERGERFEYAGGVWKADLEFVNRMGRSGSPSYTNIQLVPRRR